MFRLYNPRLIELDKEICSFNYDFWGYFFNPSDKSYYNYVKKRTESLRNLSIAIEPETEFEGFLLENIIHSLEVQQELADFFSLPNCQTSVRDIIDCTMGEDSFRILEKVMRSYNWKDIWTIYQQKESGEYNKDIVRDQESQIKIEEAVPLVKKDILEYGKANNFLPSDFDFEFTIISPGEAVKDKAGRFIIGYDPETREIKMVSDTFHCVRLNEKLRVKPSVAYYNCFHEIWGHASHANNSEKMPLSLRLSGENLGNLAALVVSEGIAESRRKLGISCLPLLLQQYGMNEREIIDEIEKTNIKFEWVFSESFHPILKEREAREIGFDIGRYIRDITGLTCWERELKKPSKLKFEEGVYYGISHMLGPQYIHKILEKIKARFGENYIQSNKRKVDAAMTTGYWTWKVYPKFLEYYLNNF